MDTNATAVIILGMHRSGTSSLAGSLQELGLYLGLVYEQNPYNKKGNRENPEIMSLNNDVLSYNGGDWRHAPDSINWSSEHERRRENILKGFIASGQPVWGFKDPRTLLTLDFWLDGLKNTAQIEFVGSFRHPAPVALSLFSRNEFSIHEGIKIWELFNTRLWELQQKTRFPLVCFDVEPAEYQNRIQQIAKGLKLPLQNGSKTFFDVELRHHAVDEPITIPSQALVLYRNLYKTYREQSS